MFRICIHADNAIAIKECCWMFRICIHADNAIAIKECCWASIIVLMLLGACEYSNYEASESERDNDVVGSEVEACEANVRVGVESNLDGLRISKNKKSTLIVSKRNCTVYMSLISDSPEFGSSVCMKKLQKGLVFADRKTVRPNGWKHKDNVKVCTD
ncbi:hypothetical protein V6Z11_A09G176400 [Gossypium hirsutum]